VETLRDVVKRLDSLDDEWVIYTDGSSPAARAAVLSDGAQKSEATGLRYFLEVALAKDAVIVWSEWRGGAEPTIDDKVMAISHYATHDAYLPLG
jgi:hypothetical protein